MPAYLPTYTHIHTYTHTNTYRYTYMHTYMYKNQEVIAKPDTADAEGAGDTNAASAAVVNVHVRSNTPVSRVDPSTMM